MKKLLAGLFLAASLMAAAPASAATWGWVTGPVHYPGTSVAFYGTSLGIIGVYLN